MCVSSLGLTHQYDVCSELSYYISQCWLIANWTFRNKLQWNLYSWDILLLNQDPAVSYLSSVRLHVPKYHTMPDDYIKVWTPNFIWLYSLCLGIEMVNSLWPSDALWPCVSWSALVQVMVCHLIIINPLPEPVLICSQFYGPLVTNLCGILIKWKCLSPPENTYENVVCKMSAILFRPQYFNTSPPSDTYMHLWIRSALVQIMACRLFGTKPLSKPMLGNCQLDP